MRVLSSFFAGAHHPNPKLRRMPVTNPADGTSLAELEIANEDWVDNAVAAARRAAPQWRQARTAERGSYLEAVADAIEENADVLARCETADTGMTLRMTRNGHIPRAIEHFRWYAAEANRLSGSCLRTDAAYLHLVERAPLGTIAIVAPWNAPLAVASLSAAAALAAGNTCVIKPSERAPLSISLLAEIMHAVGLPEGVFNVVQGDRETGRALVSHPGIAGVCFVGGQDAGREVMHAAASQVKRVVLELGGKSPTIVLADADLGTAVDGALLSAFSSNGEVCTAGSRIVVEEAIHDAFVAELIERARNIKVGPPTSPDTELGPLIDKQHFIHVERWICEALHEGATLACGGVRVDALSGGYYLSPTVFTGVHNRMSIARHEVFGPVAAVLRVPDADAAVKLANESDFGLAATLWTSNVSRGLALAAHLEAGSISINCPVIRDPRVPFGGMKCSGLGRVGGRLGLEQLTEPRVTVVPIQGYELPRLGLRAADEPLHQAAGTSGSQSALDAWREG